MITDEFSQEVAWRNIPYPYKAMLAICSDLDETPDKETYLETLRYLNTTEETMIGQGVGLEVGNTIYFDMPPDQFSYWNTDDDGRAKIRTLVKSGHIDCLHSFGDLANTREIAERNLAELTKHNCKLEVWIDHGTAPSNFDGEIMRGSGDVPDNPVYHADITCAHGIKYVWKGRVTSVIGQNQPRNLRGIWNINHPVASTKTLAKEGLKGLLARFGNQKYNMHLANSVLRKTHLHNGREVFEFIRSNPHWGGVSSCETAVGISEVLTRQTLDRLISRQGICLLYTHLGKINKTSGIFPASAIQAFELLSRYSQEKTILTTTTRRALGFCRALMESKIEVTKIESATQCNIIFSGNEKDLDGFTLYVDDPHRTTLKVNGNPRAFIINEHDSTRKHSISLPWPRLEFPDI